MTWLVRQSSTRRLLIAFAVATVVIAVAARFSLGAGAPDPTPRSIVLVASGMAFYVEGTTDKNPTLNVKAGERLRLVLRNDDPGVTHDFVVPDWQIATRALDGKGRDEILLTVPNRRGTTAYICKPHASMMRGTIVVD
jgi:plastocyanin